MGNIFNQFKFVQFIPNLKGCNNCKFAPICEGCPGYAYINGLDSDTRCDYKPKRDPNLEIRKC